MKKKSKPQRAKRRLSVEFLNDFYDEKLPEGKRDRNFAVRIH